MINPFPPVSLPSISQCCAPFLDPFRLAGRSELDDHLTRIIIAKFAELLDGTV